MIYIKKRKFSDQAKQKKEVNEEKEKKKRKIACAEGKPVNVSFLQTSGKPHDSHFVRLLHPVSGQGVFKPYNDWV